MKTYKKRRGGMFGRVLKPAVITVAKEYGKDYLKKTPKIAEGVYNDPTLVNDPEFMIRGKKKIDNKYATNISFKNENVIPNAVIKAPSEIYNDENGENYNPNILRQKGGRKSRKRSYNKKCKKTLKRRK